MRILGEGAHSLLAGVRCPILGPPGTDDTTDLMRRYS